MTCAPPTAASRYKADQTIVPWAGAVRKKRLRLRGELFRPEGAKAVTLSIILFAAAALVWPLRRIGKARGTLLPFLSVFLCCAAVAAGAVQGAGQQEMALGPMLTALSALLFGKGERKE